jgi:hypothetical protein
MSFRVAAISGPGPGGSAAGIIDDRPVQALNVGRTASSAPRRGAVMIYLMYGVVGLAVAGFLYLFIRDALDRRRVDVKRRKDR